MMKRLILFMIPLLLVWTTANAEPESPQDELPWLYTVAVGDGVRFYSFALMKDGAISFDQWSTDSEVVEETFYPTEDRFQKIEAIFETFFGSIGELPIREMDQQPTFILEQVTPELVVTHELAGAQPLIWDFLSSIAAELEIELPFRPPFKEKLEE